MIVFIKLFKGGKYNINIHVLHSLAIESSLLQ